MAEKLEGIEGDIQTAELLFTRGEIRPLHKVAFSDEENDSFRTVIRLAKLSVESSAEIDALVENLTETLHDTSFPDEFTEWLDGVIDKLALISIGGSKEDGDRPKKEKGGISENGDQRDANPKD